LSAGDDLIGRTVIDLEDRWFDKPWNEMGAENENVDSANGAAVMVMIVVMMVMMVVVVVAVVVMMMMMMMTKR
jgi:ABC-type lipoprotein release transport system permease subunit